MLLQTLLLLIIWSNLARSLPEISCGSETHPSKRLLSPRVWWACGFPTTKLKGTVYVKSPEPGQHSTKNSTGKPHLISVRVEIEYRVGDDTPTGKIIVNIGPKYLDEYMSDNKAVSINYVVAGLNFGDEGNILTKMSPACEKYLDSTHVSELEKGGTINKRMVVVDFELIDKPPEPPKRKSKAKNKESKSEESQSDLPG